MFSGDAINRHITEPQKCIGFSNPSKSTYGFIHFLVQNLKNHIKKQKFWFVLKETNQNPKNVTRFKLLAKVLDPPLPVGSLKAYTAHPEVVLPYWLNISGCMRFVVMR